MQIITKVTNESENGIDIKLELVDTEISKDTQKRVFVEFNKVYSPVLKNIPDYIEVGAVEHAMQEHFEGFKNIFVIKLSNSSGVIIMNSECKINLEKQTLFIECDPERTGLTIGSRGSVLNDLLFQFKAQFEERFESIASDSLLDSILKLDKVIVNNGNK